MKIRLLAAISASLIMAGCETIAAPDLVDTMPVSSLAGHVKYVDDPLNDYILVDTGSLTGIQSVGSVRVDFFFAAAKDRKNGNFQVGLHMRTYTSEWLFPEEIRFSSPLIARELRRLESDVDCSAYGCNHEEGRMAVLTDADIQQLLKGPDAVPVRVQCAKGYFDATLRSSELVAMLTRMSELQKYASAS